MKVLPVNRKVDASCQKITNSLVKLIAISGAFLRGHGNLQEIWPPNLKKFATTTHTDSIIQG